MTDQERTEILALIEGLQRELAEAPEQDWQGAANDDPVIGPPEQDVGY